MCVKFTISGEPQGKGRPKFSVVAGHAKARTPEKTALYENLVKLEYRAQCGQKRFADGESLIMRITAYYAIPKSKSKKQRTLMLEGKTRPTKKPDADNVLKVIADSLNEIAYKDDAQIVEMHFDKFYSDIPRVEVEINATQPKGVTTE